MVYSRDGHRVQLYQGFRCRVPKFRHEDCCCIMEGFDVGLTTSDEDVTVRQCNTVREATSIRHVLRLVTEGGGGDLFGAWMVTTYAFVRASLSS